MTPGAMHLHGALHLLPPRPEEPATSRVGPTTAFGAARGGLRIRA